jgi:hypothetical protein
MHYTFPGRLQKQNSKIFYGESRNAVYVIGKAIRPERCRGFVGVEPLDIRKPRWHKTLRVADRLAGSLPVGGQAHKRFRLATQRSETFSFVFHRCMLLSEDHES